MEITERNVADVTILDLKGRMILGEGDQVFRDRVNALMHKGRRKFLLNFEHVTFLDSAGVGSIVWKFVTLKKQGGALKLFNLSKRSHSIMAVTKLITVLETFDSEEQATRSFEETEAT